jgi:hypothetical protein
MNTKMIGAVAALPSAGALAGTSHETALVTESRAIYEVVKISPPPPTARSSAGKRKQCSIGMKMTNARVHQ